MTTQIAGFRLPVLGVLAVCASLAAGAAYAGDGQVLHVGETTTIHLESGWELDRAASRQAHLVAVSAAGTSATSRRYAVRGLKTGQTRLVFRKGPKTHQAHIDVLK